MKLDPDDDRDDVARFCAIHETSLDRRRAIFHVFRIEDPVATFAERQARINRDGERVTIPLLEATGWYGMLTGATFDTGLAAVSWHRIGMLWFADED